MVGGFVGNNFVVGGSVGTRSNSLQDKGLRDFKGFVVGEFVGVCYLVVGKFVGCGGCFCRMLIFFRT